MMFREEVTDFDAINVVVLNECAFDTRLIPDIPLHEYIILDYDKYIEIE